MQAHTRTRAHFLPITRSVILTQSRSTRSFCPHPQPRTHPPDPNSIHPNFSPPHPQSAMIVITSSGVKVLVEYCRTVQARAFLQTQLFQEYRSATEQQARKRGRMPAGHPRLPCLRPASLGANRWHAPFLPPQLQPRRRLPGCGRVPHRPEDSAGALRATWAASLPPSRQCPAPPRSLASQVAFRPHRSASPYLAPASTLRCACPTKATAIPST